MFDQYQPGRFLQLQMTSERFRISEIEMTFADMCMYFTQFLYVTTKKIFHYFKMNLYKYFDAN